MKMLHQSLANFNFACKAKGSCAWQSQLANTVIPDAMG